MTNLLLRLLTSLLLTTSVHAGILALSGDSNIGNGIDGSAGLTLAQNGIFFSNLLGSGTKVVLQTTSNKSFSENASISAITTYYSQLPGVTAATLPANSDITSAQLAGANLFIGFLPDTGYSTTSLNTLSAFLARGGSVLFTAEWSGFDAGSGIDVNDALTALGSPLQDTFANADIFNGNVVATGAQIVPGPLTAGIANFSYAAVSGVTGGNPVFLATTGAPFLEYTNFAPTAATPEPATAFLIFTTTLLLIARRIQISPN